ncbi:hypothetical protein FRB90_009014 [Tulasnella sp. 427]|nr:hypothetical protein FRB90_009014 [Tulasnella sp. 427]
MASSVQPQSADPAPTSPSSAPVDDQMATHSKDSTTAQSATANTKKSGSSRPSSVTKTSPSPVVRKVKQSFWQSLVSVLLPCTSSKSTSRAHDIDVDGGANVADTAASKAAANKVDNGGEKKTEAEGKKPAAAKEDQEKDKARAAGPSSFKLIPQADYVVPVEIEWQWHNVYVIKRPGVDNFLKKMGEIYEVVIFTASLSKYADPVLDKLDIHKVVAHRLFRESCYNHRGNYVKDLSRLGRPVEDMIILDNSPASYIFHPNNAVPVSSWFNDPHDTELTDLCPFLADLTEVEDVRGVLDGGI